MTTTQQGQPEAVSADGAVADEVPPRYHARDSDTTGSYADLIIQISEQSSTAKSAGTRWEQVVVSFLSTDPLYRHRFASVETFADWAARDATRSTSQDRGVDLIAIQHDGKFTATKYKFTEGRWINWENIGMVFLEDIPELKARLESWHSTTAILCSPTTQKPCYCGYAN